MKKKGSALVFSILMLSFFLAISLNIFFQARKKAERAGVKVQGEKTTNNIDIASSLGYQELKLAESLVREGIVYDNTHPSTVDSYTLPGTGSYLYIDPATGDFSNRYAGIQINNFIDYFSSSWHPGTTLNQKLIIGEEIASGDIVSRMWQSSGVASSITPLWDPSNPPLSIGGYRLKSSDFISTSDGSYTAVYEKFILLQGNSTLGIPQSVFRIEITENFQYTALDSDVSNRQILNFLIEAID